MTVDARRGDVEEGRREKGCGSVFRLKNTATLRTRKRIGRLYSLWEITGGALRVAGHCYIDIERLYEPIGV